MFFTVNIHAQCISGETEIDFVASGVSGGWSDYALLMGSASSYLINTPGSNLECITDGLCYTVTLTGSAVLEVYQGGILVSTPTNGETICFPFAASTPGCNKSVIQNLNGFNPDPVYALWVWSYDTLTLTNTSDCDIRVRPEFDIYHDSIDISQGDFDLKWLSPFGNWSDLNYYIDANGHAVGYWSFGADTTGQPIAQGDSAKVIIRSRFRPGANYGTYYANWITTGNIFLKDKID